MSISFNQVPSNNRVPFLFAEFDSSKAQQGSAIKQYAVLMFGQKRSAGSATADVPTLVTRESDAISKFGRGSQLHLMCKRFLEKNKFNELTVIPQADNGAGVTASGSVTFAGTATAAGTLSAYIANQKVETAVAIGDTAAQVATNFNTDLAAALDLPVTAAVDGVTAEKVNITCRHKGLLGNEIDIRFNFNPGEKLPAGITATIVAMASGTTAPSLTNSIANMTEKQYDVVCFPYTDATSMTAIETELEDRWGAVRQNDGRGITCKAETVSNLGTYGTGRNSKQMTCFGIYKFRSPAWEVAASAAAVAAYYLQIDPARPLRTLALDNIGGPAPADEFDMSERNILLHDGIATLRLVGGVVQIERAITMYQLNDASAPDTAYLDINTTATLSFIRYDWRSYMTSKYPRHKLANDGTRFGPGQAVMTPKLARAEAVAKFSEWEEAGLVEGFDQFKRDLISERNASDPNRLDISLSPDLINQLTVVGTKISFLL